MNRIENEQEAARVHQETDVGISRINSSALVFHRRLCELAGSSRLWLQWRDIRFMMQSATARLLFLDAIGRNQGLRKLEVCLPRALHPALADKTTTTDKMTPYAFKCSMRLEVCYKISLWSLPFRVRGSSC